MGKVKYILSGRNYFRYSAVILLYAMVVLSLVLAIIYSLFWLSIIPAAAFGIISITFPRLVVSGDSFVIENSAILKAFSDSIVFRFADLEDVEFKPGEMHVLRRFVQIVLGTTGKKGFAIRDRMIIHTKEGDHFTHLRFGTREQFEEAIRLINSLL